MRSATKVPEASGPGLRAHLPDGPGGPRAWIAANFTLRPTAFIEECSERYGDYFTVRLPARTVVISSHPAAVEAAFTGDPEHMKAGVGNEVLKPLLGAQSVLLLDGREHMRQRKLLLPPFHGERMRAYRPTMRLAAEREVARWPRGKPFAAQPAMQSITLEVILRTVFGVSDQLELEHLARPLKHLLDALSNRARLLGMFLTDPASESRLSPWGEIRKLLDAADSVIFEQIASRRRQAGGEDILALLLEAVDEDGRGLTDQELRDELMTLLLAGHETTATALSWTLELLSCHSAVLGQLKSDLATGSTDYLDAVIKESLRLRPVVPAVARYLTEPTAVGSRVLPAGVHLTPSIYLLHRREDLYPYADVFRPDRFLDVRPKTYEWIPFGGGVRRCLGASFALFEMQEVLQSVLDRVELETKLEPEKTTRRSITLAPARGARLVIG